MATQSGDVMTDVDISGPSADQLPFPWSPTVSLKHNPLLEANELVIFG